MTKKPLTIDEAAGLINEFNRQYDWFVSVGIKNESTLIIYTKYLLKKVPMNPTFHKYNIEFKVIREIVPGETARKNF